MYGAYCVATVLSREQCLVERVIFATPALLHVFKHLFVPIYLFVTCLYKVIIYLLFTVHLLNLFTCFFPFYLVGELNFRVFIFSNSIYRV
jgi:hypothetical protein